MIADFQIRPLTTDDQPFLWEMLYYAIHIPEGYQPPPFEIVYEPDLAHYVAGWGRPADFGFVAVDTAGQKPVGACWLRTFSDDDKSYGFVDSDTPELTIALLPGYRGKGIGEALLNAALEAAKSSYNAVSLSVSGDNRALKLYRRAGFVEVDRDTNGTLTMLKRF